MSNAPKVVVTGSGWGLPRTESVSVAIERLIRGASEELCVVAYSFGFGADPLIPLVEYALQRGVRIRMLLNRFPTQSPQIRENLLRLVSEYRHCELYSFFPAETNEDLHAKVLVADRSIALVGSANLSTRGLVVNHELALRVEGRTAWDIAEAVDQLLAANNLVVKVLPGRMD